MVKYKHYWSQIITLSYINFPSLNHPLKTDMKNEVIKNKSTGQNNNKKGFNHPHKKVEILDPYHNRTQIAKVAKKSKGVYLFEIENLNIKYVGCSINLYNRVCSYFMHSIFSKADRKVIRYFNKYGFSQVKLTLFILEEHFTWEQVIELEQYFIDSLSPHFNVDLVAGSYNGYHLPITLKAG